MPGSMASTSISIFLGEGPVDPGKRAGRLPLTVAGSRDPEFAACACGPPQYPAGQVVWQQRFERHNPASRSLGRLHCKRRRPAIRTDIITGTFWLQFRSCPGLTSGGAMAGDHREPRGME